MRASRLLSILLLLQLRVRVTAEALAEEFEVSVRTIYRDIDALSAAGVPVYGDRGPGGGFQLLDGYRTRLTGLATDEAEAMLMIGLPGPAAALGLGPASLRARQKLLAALPQAGSDGAGRIAERFHLDPADWYRCTEPATHLPALTRAVLDQRSLSMRYESWTSVRDWAAEPFGLVLKGSAWYLVARGAGKVRMFRVSNIQSLEIGSAGFERPPDFDLAKWWAEALDRFEAELRPMSVQLQLSPTGLRRLSESGAYAARAVDAAVKADATGWRTVTLPIESHDQASRLILGLGPEVKVLDDALRQAVHQMAMEIAGRMAISG